MGGRFLAAMTMLFVLASTGTATAGDPAPSATEREFVGLLNQERVRQGLAPVQISPPLTDISDDYARENDRLGDIDHDRDAPYTKRANAAGCGKWLGPVLSLGSRDAADLLQVWLDSEGHRAVLLDPEVTHIGPGISDNSGVAYAMPCSGAQNDSGDFGANFTPGAAPKPPAPGPQPPASRIQRPNVGRPSAAGRRVRIAIDVFVTRAPVRITARSGRRRVVIRRTLRSGQGGLAFRLPRGAARWTLRITIDSDGSSRTFTRRVRIR